jgi:hypothetical protein
MVAKFVSAYESAHLDALLVLLTDDVFISMPAVPFEYQGRDIVARFFAGILGAGRRFDLVRTRANGQPAVGAYLRAPTAIRHGVGLYVLALTGDRICAMTRFENCVLSWFGLPRLLPSRWPVAVSVVVRTQFRVNLWSKTVSSRTFCGKGLQQSNKTRGNGTAAVSFGERLLNECADATISCSLRESSAYLGEFFTTGVTAWTSAMLLLRERAR